MYFKWIQTLILLLFLSSPILAAVFTVTNTNNVGPGSLRQAVIDANASPAYDIIDFDASFSTPRTIVLAGAITITGSQANGVTIIGPGRDLLTLSANNVSQIFRNTGSADALITSLSVTQGRLAMGGAIYSSGNMLTLIDVRISASTATMDGGAVFVDLGFFSCNGCIITGNTAARNGGGIFFDGGATGTFSQTTISGNQALSATNPAETGGGGIYIFPTNGGIISIGNTTISENSTPQGANGAGIFIGSGISVPIFSTTISGNVAGGDGGGMAVGDAKTDPVNTTIGNTARNGGGIYRTAGSAFRLAGFSSSTIVNNTASADGGGYYGTVGNLGSFLASIVASNTAGGTGPDILGTVESKGYNIIRSTAGNTLTGDLTGNILGQDPLLGPLANYGGMVETHTVFFGSPAIDANNAQTGTAVDARGKARLTDGDGNGSAIPDIGAFERHPGILQFSSSAYSIFEGALPLSVLITVSRSDGTDGPVAVQIATSDGTATSGNDYSPFNGSFLALSDGVAAQTFSIPIINDFAVEPDETFTVSVVNPMFGAKLVSPSSASVTIRDNDTPVTVSGRVTSPSGQNLRAVVVSIIDSQGIRATATTSSFGVYTFDNITPGRQYTLTAASKRYRFAPQVLQVNNSQTVNLIGLE